MKIGEEVYITSFLGTLTNDIVTKISTRMDINTKELYDVIHCNRWKFDSRTKYSISEPYDHYYGAIV